MENDDEDDEVVGVEGIVDVVNEVVDRVSVVETVPVAVKKTIAVTVDVADGESEIAAVCVKEN